MEQKFFEIRDRGTTIAALAIRMIAADVTEHRFLRHCGYPEDGSSIVLMKLYDQRATNDPYEWPSFVGDRTMSVAHHHILCHFSELQSGQVIDVEVILGEKEIILAKIPEIGRYL